MLSVSMKFFRERDFIFFCIVSIVWIKQAIWDAIFLSDLHQEQVVLSLGSRPLPSPSYPQIKDWLYYKLRRVWEALRDYPEIFEAPGRQDTIWAIFWQTLSRDLKSSTQAVCTCRLQQLQQIPRKLSDLYTQSHYITHVAT